MARRVDFPQPDGPEIDTYSPRRSSRCIPANACVSTSSVTNTLVTPSICSNASCAFILPVLLLEADPVVPIHRRHIGEEDLISHFQSFNHFYRCDGCPSKLDRDPNGFLSVEFELEKRNSRVRLAQNRPCDMEHVIQAFNLD